MVNAEIYMRLLGISSVNSDNAQYREINELAKSTRLTHPLAELEQESGYSHSLTPSQLRIFFICGRLRRAIFALNLPQ